MKPLSSRGTSAAYAEEQAGSRYLEILFVERFLALGKPRNQLLQVSHRGAFRLNVGFEPVASAPSKARLCQPGEETGTESLGQASDTECCVGSGNADGEAYTGR